MKSIFHFLIITSLSLSAFGQGAVVFNNSVGTEVNAPVTRSSCFGATVGQGPGAGYTAQLALVGTGGSLTLLFPTTTFRTTSAAAEFFVNSVDVTIPDVAPGSPARLRMQVWPTVYGTYMNAYQHGISAQSANFTVTTGGGVMPPANLVGLQGFTIMCIPEPSTVGIGLIGMIIIFRFRYLSRCRST
jgi:hypothetical protein